MNQRLGERREYRGCWGRGWKAGRLVTLIGLVLAVSAGASTACADPGDRDPSFSRDGRVRTDIAGDNDGATAVALQSDGRIVAAGFSSAPGAARRLTLVRYDTDGTLDPSFGDEGIVITRIGDESAAQAVAIQPDGKIVVTGIASHPEQGWDFAVARYQPGGTLDDSFSGDGRLTTDFDGGADGAHALALTPDGNLVVAGESEGDFALARYEPDGDLDTSFSGDGLVTTDFSGFADSANALVLQPDGKPVLAGYANNSLDRLPAVARYEPDGDLDPSFGDDGRVIRSDFHRPAYALVRLDDGRLVAAGDGGLLGLNPDGSENSSFDSANSTRRDVSDMRALTVQADGRLVAAGSMYIFSAEFQVTRWSSDGSRDRAFGAVSSPHSSSPFPGAPTDFGVFREDGARAAAIQPNGAIVAVGQSKRRYNAPGDFAVARYRADDAGSADADADGVRDVPDLCPRRYSAEEPDGCLHYPVTVTIRYSDRDHGFRGQVSTPQPQCRFAKVVVFERKRSGDVRIGRGFGPRYFVHLPRSPGRYYAEASDDRPWPELLGICDSASSPLLRVRK